MYATVVGVKIKKEKMKFKFLLIITALYACYSFAYIGDKSNFGLSEYPEFYRSQPYPPAGKDKFSYDQYRYEVEEYVKKTKEYLEAADNDIRRIQDAQEKAARKAKQVIEDFNNWVQYGY